MCMIFPHQVRFARACVCVCDSLDVDGTSARFAHHAVAEHNLAPPDPYDKLGFRGIGIAKRGKITWFKTRMLRNPIFS
jgi:hypothetical protein